MSSGVVSTRTGTGYHGDRSPARTRRVGGDEDGEGGVGVDERIELAGVRFVEGVEGGPDGVEKEAARDIVKGIEATTLKGVVTVDLGGTAKTKDIAANIIENILS